MAEKLPILPYQEASRGTPAEHPSLAILSSLANGILNQIGKVFDLLDEKIFSRKIQKTVPLRDIVLTNRRIEVTEKTTGTLREKNTSTIYKDRETGIEITVCFENGKPIVKGNERNRKDIILPNESMVRDAVIFTIEKEIRQQEMDKNAFTITGRHKRLPTEAANTPADEMKNREQAAA